MIVLRLWSLQVLSGEHYRALAKDNGIRDVRVQPPRGEILDRNGKVLVDNRTVMSLELRPVGPTAAPEPSAGGSSPSWSDLPGLSQPSSVGRSVERPHYAGYPIVLRQGLEPTLLFYLLENRERFPGRQRRADLCAQVYARHARRPRTRDRRPGQPPPAEAAAVPRARSPATSSAKPGSSTPTTSSCAAPPGRQRIQVDALGTPKRGQLGKQTCRGRGQPAPDARLRFAGDRRGGARAEGPARCLRGDERPHRRRARDGLLSRL